MTRRGSRDCRHATLNRPCVQISHSGVTEQEHTDVQAATHNGGSVRGYQAIFVLLAALSSPGYSPMGGQPAVYLYITALEANCRFCR
jgi:hypothetical protein